MSESAVCLRCGGSFDRNGNGRPALYCSKLCGHRERLRRKQGLSGPLPRVSLAERLGAKTVAMGEHLVYTGSPLGGGGHGGIYVAGRMVGAHRVAWALANGVDPSALSPELVVRHSCDIPRCVNPDHLDGSSQKDNFVDMVNRGRYRNSGTGPLEHECPGCGHRF